MPTYEYECKVCGHHFEKFQSMTEDPIEVCPKCGGKVVRLISKNVNFILKGSGFYKTDYAMNKKDSNGNGKKEKKEEKKETSKEAAT